MSDIILDVGTLKWLGALVAGCRDRISTEGGPHMSREYQRGAVDACDIIADELRQMVAVRERKTAVPS